MAITRVWHAKVLANALNRKALVGPDAPSWRNWIDWERTVRDGKPGRIFTDDGVVSWSPRYGKWAPFLDVLDIVLNDWEVPRYMQA